MDAAEFLGLEPTHNPSRWVLPVTDGIITDWVRQVFVDGARAAGVALDFIVLLPDDKQPYRVLAWTPVSRFATPGAVASLEVP